MSRALKENDVLELSKLFEAEFNQPDIHDRTLVLDVVGSASWLRSQTKPNIEESEGSEDEADNEADQTEEKKNEPVKSDSPEKEPESNDCEIRAEQSQTDEIETCDEIKTDDIQAATEASKSEDAPKAIKNESVPNESEKITRNTGSEKDKRSLHDSEIDLDSCEASMNNKKQREDNTENYGSSNAINEDEIIRQHKFYIHSSWLAVQSTYFRSMFFSGMKESNAREVHVQISVCEEKSHLMLLEAMYKIDTLDDASVDELLEVLRLAHKYDVKFVFKKCKYCLQAAVVSFEICEQVMRFIKVDNDITDVEDLATTLQSFLAKEFCPLDKTWQTTSFEELCEPSLRYLLSSDDLVVASENTVFHALIYWIEQRGLDNVSHSKGLPSLLSVVRFEVMPIDYLYNTVQHNPVAKKLADFNEHYLRGISYHAFSEKIKQRISSKPLKRKAGVESYVPYTWVIPTDKLLKLVGTEEKLKSDIFWFCGYEMVLIISHVQPQKYYAEQYITKLSLVIMNLTQQNVVDISWQPVSGTFNSTPGTRSHTFTKDACGSSVDITCTIETKQEVPPTSSVGFSFSTATTSGGFLIPSPSSRTVTTAPSVLTFPSVPTTVSSATTQAPSSFSNPPSISFRVPHTSQSSVFTFTTSQPTKPTGSLPFTFVSSRGRTSCSTTNTNMVASSKTNFPKPDSPTTPCLSIDIKMNLI